MYVNQVKGKIFNMDFVVVNKWKKYIYMLFGKRIEINDGVHIIVAYQYKDIIYVKQFKEVNK